MKDEEGLVLKAVPRDPSEEPVIAAQNTADVVEGVENPEITPDPKANKKRKEQSTEEELEVATKVRDCF